MRRRASRATQKDDWIGLNEATEMLGVSASTLRRWADEGTVRTFVTPGGHRRFSRSGIEALLPGGRRVPADPDVLAGETPARMQRVYRRAVQQGASADLAWLADLDAGERGLFRDHGRRIVVETLLALEAADADEREVRLESGQAAAAAYGRAAAAIGLPVSAAVALFLRFRGPFMGELSAVSRRRALSAAASTGLLEDAREMFDRLLVAMVVAHEATNEACSAGAIAEPLDGAVTVETVAPLETVLPMEDVETREPVASNGVGR